jgi:hypothetical protein
MALCFYHLVAGDPFGACGRLHVPQMSARPSWLLELVPHVPFSQTDDWHVEASAQGDPSGDSGLQVIVVTSHAEVAMQPLSEAAQEAPSARRGAHCGPLVAAPNEQ